MKVAIVDDGSGDAREKVARVMAEPQRYFRKTNGERVVAAIYDSAGTLLIEVGILDGVAPFVAEEARNLDAIIERAEREDAQPHVD